MLYSEFISNTGCKDSEYNYKVYRSLEALYMDNDSMTKEDVYKAGKTLVNNEKSEKEKEIEENIKKEIETIDNDNAYYKDRIETYKRFIETDRNKDNIKAWQDSIKEFRRQIKRNNGYKKRLLFFYSI